MLVLGLRLAGTDIVAVPCDDHAGFAVPLRLTLHQLATTDSLRARHDRVLVCENPAVVAAATARLGELEQEPAHPLVCVEGMPDVAADRLLSALATGGAALAFHADFDWDGIRIGNVLHSRYGAAGWRFGAADYRSAAQRIPVTFPLAPRAGEAAWDAGLGAALRDVGRVVSEEQVVDDLLGDLVGE